MANNFKQLRSRLEEDQKRLRQELDQMESSSQPSETRREGSPFGKREEEATETLELEKRLALEKQIKESLTEVDRALLKMDEGTYGSCDVCGKLINPERLEALPQASLCLDCRAKHLKRPVG